MPAEKKPAPVRTAVRRASALALAACLIQPALAQQDPLAAAFANPPAPAHPPRLVALDEWKHHQRRHHAGP